MSRFTLDREITLPYPQGQVFEFFARPENLEFLTPPWLRFRITTPLPILMEEGARIRYRLRLKGFPINWESLITAWDPPHRFVDQQVKGPYRVWIHEHTFERTDGGTLVRDRVEYEVPGGTLVNRLFVRSYVEAIFDYRRDQLGVRFPTPTR